MKVKELVEKLQSFPQDADVYLDWCGIGGVGVEVDLKNRKLKKIVRIFSDGVQKIPDGVEPMDINSLC